MYKVCPSCGDEFQPRVDECPDCHCALEWPRETAPESEAAPADLPPADQLTCVKIDEGWRLRDLAGHLQRRGLSSRIDSHPPGRPLAGPDVLRRGGLFGSSLRLGLYVRPDDAERAARILAPHLTGERPADAEEGQGEHPGQAPEAGDVCPACGSPLRDGDAACGECGLAFVAAPGECPACGARCETEDTECSTCGGAL